MRNTRVSILALSFVVPVGCTITTIPGQATVYVPPAQAKPGTPLEIEIRGRRSPAIVVAKPFYRKIAQLP